MKNYGRGAFTLVELLVVMAIIAMLIGMMIPGVQAMQEAARRATCRSHLSQIGVALQNYEAAHSVFPPGTLDPKGPVRSVPQGNHISWIVHLLPYLDEGATFKHVDFSAGAYDDKNAPVARVHVAALTCPTDRSPRSKAVWASSYAGCHHDVEAPIDQDNHGVLFLNSHIAARDVTDGLAHTIFVGEKRSQADDLGWMSGTRATLRNTGTPLGGTLTGGELTVGGFGSYHPCGAYFLMGDGAVRFVSNEIETTVYRYLGNRADGQILSGGPTREE